MHVELLEEAEMSQIENAVTSSSKTKRVIEKATFIGGRETENVCFRKKESTANNVFIDKQLKDDLVQLCETKD
jgi:hypothetical protein